MAKRFSYYDPHTTQPFRISRSKVQLFLDCPRCFYLDVRLGIKRPPGFPFSLNSAVDALLKKEFDVHRENKTMHPYIKETGLNAIPYQHENLDLWRNNFKGVSCLHKRTNFETFLYDKSNEFYRIEEIDNWAKSELPTGSTFEDFLPTQGTLVLFDSVSLPHEVQITKEGQRLALAGWFHETIAQT